MIRKDLLKEWDFEKNGSLNPNLLSEQSNKVVWWICEHGHSWKKRIQSRHLYNKGCPKCNSLAFKYPEVASELHPNNFLDAWEISYGSGKKLKWRCSEGHEWTASVVSRTVGTYKKRGLNCPYCGNKKISKTNNLAAVAPHLLKEWDYKKTTKTLSKFLQGVTSKRIGFVIVDTLSVQ